MSGHLTADREQLERFIVPLFAHAAPGAFVSLRSFPHRQGERPARIEAVKLNGHGLDGLVTAALRHGTWAANYREPLVVAPPIAVFTNPKHATEADLAQGLVISVEADERPRDALAGLMDATGLPTVIMASGGTWADPETGEVQDKLHLHWRLAMPTTTPEEHGRLKRVRRLAALLVGADPTAAPICHPLRWAGSWHLKDPQHPRLARVVGGDPEMELELADAEARIEVACRAAGIDPSRAVPNGGAPGDRQEPRDTAELVRRITSGTEYLAPLVALSARYAAAGLSKRQIAETLLGFLEAVPPRVRDLKDGKPVPGRWQDRVNSLERMAASAVSKFAPAKASAAAAAAHPAAEATAEADGPSSAPEPPQRPVIQLGGGRLHDVVAASEQALGAAGGVYQRGALLVRVARLAEATSGSIRRAAGSLTIVPMDRATLRVRLTEAARFERFDGRAEQWRPSDCPGDVAEAVLSAVGTWPSIPPLVGIVQAPPLRPDGTVLDQPGYDAASGLLLDPGDAVFPPIPAAPSRAEAERALRRLRAPFADFPFAAEADLAVIISAVLTALVRPTLRAAPAFLLTAPTMGSGKTLLATIASYIATGRAPAMMSQADDAEAERKRLLAVLLEGGAVTVIDNVERPLASDALCSILTEPVFRDRVLGVTRTAAVPTNTTWFVTGNNAQVVGDLTVRVLTCRLDPACERPEERTFNVDLHREVPRQRGELAAAALTIIRAYLAAGSPPQPVPTFGRFEQWQAWCRFPLIWLGLADPCSTRAAAEGKDPVRARLGALLEGWRGLFGSDELTVAAAIKALGKAALDDAGRAALGEAMREIAGEKDGINGRRLGNFIARHEGRFERGLRFERGEAGYLGVFWRVRSAGKDQGLQGFKGFRQPPTRECQNDSYIETTGKNPGNPANPGSATLDDEGIDL